MEGGQKGTVAGVRIHALSLSMPRTGMSAAAIARKGAGCYVAIVTRNVCMLETACTARTP